MIWETSLQIKLEAEKGNLHLIDTVLDKIDIVFDGADQIDKGKNLIKGGGGALLRENILINAAKKVVIMADDSKFVTNFDRSVPVEIHKERQPLIKAAFSKKMFIEGLIKELRKGNKEVHCEIKSYTTIMSSGTPYSLTNPVFILR